MAEEGKDATVARPRKRQRLAVRAATLLVQHADGVSAICYFAGLVVLLLLPLLAKNTHISENALLVGSADALFDRVNAENAGILAEDLKSLVSQSTNVPMDIQKWLISNLEALGADSCLQPFTASGNPFDATRFFTTSSKNASKDYHWQVDGGDMEVSESSAVNVVGILRAPRGEGTDAIVLVTPFDMRNFNVGGALALGLGMEVFELLSRALWLAKDVVWLVADARYGSYAAVAAWLKEYHEPELNFRQTLLSGDACKSEAPFGMSRYGVSPSLLERGCDCWKTSNDVLLGDFKRAGRLAAGVVVELRQGEGCGPRGVDCVQVRGEALNGQMPNLDLVSVCNKIATGWGQGFHTILDSSRAVFNSSWARFVGNVVETVGRQARKLNPQWGYHLQGAEDYVGGMATLVTSMSNQALGVPTGAHGAFRDYQVDAVTLQISSGGSMANVNTRLDTIEKVGRLLELIVRSVNNLLEKFHHSPFLYVMTSPFKFVAIGVYMIPVLLLLISFPLEAASLLSFGSGSQKHAQAVGKPDTPQEEGSHGKAGGLEDVEKERPASVEARSHGVQSVQSWAVVLVIHLWSAFVAILPPVLHATVDQASFLSLPWLKGLSVDERRVLVWTLLAAFSLWAAVQLIAWVNRSCGFPDLKSWRTLKGFMLGSATIGLGVMSVLNYAVALVGAVALIPMCLTVAPLRRTWKKITSGSTSRPSLILLLIQNLLTILASPPFLLVLSMCLLGFPSQLDLGAVWHATELLWSWGSGLYLYALLVHLPCTILCFHILVMPSS